MSTTNKSTNSQSPIANIDNKIIFGQQISARNIKTSQNWSRRRMVEICRTPAIHSSPSSSSTLSQPNRRCPPFQFQYLLFLAISFLIASSSLFVCQARAAASIQADEDILRTLPSKNGPKGVDDEDTVVELRLLDQQADEADFLDKNSENEEKAAIEDINDPRTESSIRPIDEAIWWYFLANLKENMKQQRRHNFGHKISGQTKEEEEEENGRSSNLAESLFKSPAKKAPIRRCGTLLIKHIQTVCNGCLRSASDADPIIMSKRGGSENPLKEARNRWKREVGFSKITDICCTQRACADDELKPFCC